jgi:hypothetical protein
MNPFAWFVASAPQVGQATGQRTRPFTGSSRNDRMLPQPHFTLISIVVLTCRSPTCAVHRLAS